MSKKRKEEFLARKEKELQGSDDEDNNDYNKPFKFKLDDSNNNGSKSQWWDNKEEQENNNNTNKNINCFFFNFNNFIDNTAKANTLKENE